MTQEVLLRIFFAASLIIDVASFVAIRWLKEKNKINIYLIMIIQFILAWGPTIIILALKFDYYYIQTVQYVYSSFCSAYIIYEIVRKILQAKKNQQLNECINQYKIEQEALLNYSQEKTYQKCNYEQQLGNLSPPELVRKYFLEIVNTNNLNNLQKYQINWNDIFVYGKCHNYDTKYVVDLIFNLLIINSKIVKENYDILKQKISEDQKNQEVLAIFRIIENNLRKELKIINGFDIIAINNQSDGRFNKDENTFIFIEDQQLLGYHKRNDNIRLLRDLSGTLISRFQLIGETKVICQSYGSILGQCFAFAINQLIIDQDGQDLKTQIVRWKEYTQIFNDINNYQDINDKLLIQVIDFLQKNDRTQFQIRVYVISEDQIRLIQTGTGEKQLNIFIDVQRKDIGYEYIEHENKGNNQNNLGRKQQLQPQQYIQISENQQNYVQAQKNKLQENLIQQQINSPILQNLEQQQSDGQEKNLLITCDSENRVVNLYHQFQNSDLLNSQTWNQSNSQNQTTQYNQELNFQSQQNQQLKQEDVLKDKNEFDQPNLNNKGFNPEKQPQNLPPFQEQVEQNDQQQIQQTEQQGQEQKDSSQNTNEVINNQPNPKDIPPQFQEVEQQIQQTEQQGQEEKDSSQNTNEVINNQPNPKDIPPQFQEVEQQIQQTEQEGQELKDSSQTTNEVINNQPNPKDIPPQFQEVEQQILDKEKTNEVILSILGNKPPQLQELYQQNEQLNLEKKDVQLNTNQVTSPNNQPKFQNLPPQFQQANVQILQNVEQYENDKLNERNDDDQLNSNNQSGIQYNDGSKERNEAILLNDQSDAINESPQFQELKEQIQQNNHLQINEQLQHQPDYNPDKQGTNDKSYQILNLKFYIPSFKVRQVEDEYLKKFIRDFKNIQDYQQEYNLNGSQQELLINQIKIFIPIRGDGNCLFTSIGFQYIFYNLIDTQRYQRLIKIIDSIEFKQNYEDQSVVTEEEQDILRQKFKIQLQRLITIQNPQQLLSEIAQSINNDEGPFYGLLIIFLRNYFRKLLQDFYDTSEMNFLIQSPELIDEIITWEHMYDETDIALNLFSIQEQILIRCFQKMNVNDQIVQISEYKGEDQKNFLYMIGLAFQPGHYNAILLNS